MDWGLFVLKFLAIFYVCCEILYYIIAKCWLAPRLGRKVEPQKAWFKSVDVLVKDVFDALKSIEDAYSFEAFLYGSFLRAPVSEIQGGNFDSFLCWALYTKKIEQVTDEEESNIVSHRRRIEKQFDMSWTDETTPGIKHIQFNLDDLGYVHHPLMLKGLIGSMELHSDITNFYWNGFCRETAGSSTYWYREMPGSQNTPLVFFHGICSGWFFYAKIMKAVSSGRTVILYDNMSTMLNSWSYSAPTAQELNDNLLLILKKHRINKITLFGHSWGTYLAGWVVQMNPQIIQHLVLVDPACFAASLPETAYTVLYKPSQSTEDYLLAYFLRADLTLSHTLRRCVAWYNIYFTFSYIPDHIAVTVGLSAEDILISYAALNKMTDDFLALRNEKVKLDTTEGIAPCKKFAWKIPHAEAMTRESCIDEIIANIDDFNNVSCDMTPDSSSDRMGHGLHIPLIRNSATQ